MQLDITKMQFKKRILVSSSLQSMVASFMIFDYRQNSNMETTDSKSAICNLKTYSRLESPIGPRPNVSRINSNESRNRRRNISFV